jgi:hypothetical protein
VSRRRNATSRALVRSSAPACPRTPRVHPTTSASGPRPRLPEAVRRPKAVRASKSVPSTHQATARAGPAGRAPPCPLVRPVPSLPQARLPRYDRRTAALMSRFLRVEGLASPLPTRTCLFKEPPFSSRVSTPLSSSIDAARRAPPSVSFHCRQMPSIPLPGPPQDSPLAC